MKKAIIVVFASIILTTLTACATAPTTEPTLKSTKVTMEPATSQTVKSDSISSKYYYCKLTFHCLHNQ